MRFESLGLSPNILQNIKHLGFTTTFPIQAKAIPPILAGKDIMGIAPTGSGKTASFVIPLLEKLQKDKVEKNRNINVLVLVSTRELAVQIDEVFRSFSDYLRRDIRSLAVYGGVSIQPQMKALYGVEILVATPGRLLELVEKNAVELSQVQHLVVDEADKLFHMGFEEEMNQLLQMLPKRKQTLLFSATLNDKVEELKTKLNINPQILYIEGEKLDLEQIVQEVYLVKAEQKGPFLRSYSLEFCI